MLRFKWKLIIETFYEECEAYLIKQSRKFHFPDDSKIDRGYQQPDGQTKIILTSIQ